VPSQQLLGQLQTQRNADTGGDDDDDDDNSIQFFIFYVLCQQL
jgi:hypothetical protein